MERVTYNFMPLEQVGKKQSEAGNLLSNYKKNKPDSLLYDQRNSIWCIEPSMDFTCYFNYIQYLNSKYDSWKSYGYLDIGLVPVLIAPSFMTVLLNEQIDVLAKTWGVPFYRMKPISFFNTSYNSSVLDAWVKKEDLARVLSCNVEEATLSKLLKQLKEREGQL